MSWLKERVMWLSSHWMNLQALLDRILMEGKRYYQWYENMFCSQLCDLNCAAQEKTAVKHRQTRLSFILVIIDGYLHINRDSALRPTPNLSWRSVSLGGMWLDSRPPNNWILHKLTDMSRNYVRWKLPLVTVGLNSVLEYITELITTFM